MKVPPRLAGGREARLASPAATVPTAFEAMYRDNVAAVHRYATSRLGRVEGEDVVAEVFHAAVVAVRDGRAASVTTPWLMAVTRNKVIDRWRRDSRRMARRHLVTVRTEDLTEFPADWHHEVRRYDVLAALDRLKPRHRSALVLHYVDGMTAPEMAEALGCSVAAIESTLARARRAFRRHFEEAE